MLKLSKMIERIEDFFLGIFMLFAGLLMIAGGIWAIAQGEIFWGFISGGAGGVSILLGTVSIFVKDKENT